MDQNLISEPRKINDFNEIKNLATTLEVEISLVLESLLSQFKDRKKGIRIISKKMGIHEKTVIRLLNNENRPGYQTVFKIYRVFFNEFNDAKVLELVPEVVRDYLIKCNPQELIPNKNYSPLADLELQKNPIVSEIYIIAATGPVGLEDIETRFGNYGVSLLNKMLENKLLCEVHKHVYITGDVRPVFTGETILSVGSTMIANHAKPLDEDVNWNNYISFYAEGINEETYRKWIEIDEEAHNKKLELARDSANFGNTRAFTFMITEKIELNKLQ